MSTPPDGRRDLIQVRRDTASDWAAVNPVLAAGELGYDTTNNILKIGDGATAWTDLEVLHTGRYVLDSDVLDEDDFATDSATKPPSQQSVKAATAPRSALYIPSGSGNYVSQADDAAFDGLTQLEIVIRLAADDWSTGGVQVWVARNAASNHTFQFGVSNSNTLFATLSTDGTATTLIASQSTTDTIGLVGGTPYWFKFTWRSSDGACTMSYAPDSNDEPSSWTPITLNGALDTGPTTALFSGTSAVTVGSQTPGGNPGPGKYHRAIIRSSIGGTKIADLRLDLPFASRFRDDTGRTWTLTGSGWSWTLGKA